MGATIEFARRTYHGVRRLLGIEQPRPEELNPFPVDAWADSGYEQWFKAHRATDAELARQRTEAAGMAERPVFSFIVPLYRTPLDYLETMARSVLGQTYPALQLVLVNASPELPDLAEAVAALAERDARVTVVALEGNLGITENTNAGIAAATGEFCCFLDHDDFIEPDLLFEYVRALNEHADIDVLYCDEDLVQQDGKTGGFRHLHVLFKNPYAPELMLCKNGIVHLMTVRRSLIDRMPRPDYRLDGAQDYNMILFCAGAARRVHGVQKVLYHWRVSEQSTAANPDAKPYSQKSYRLAAQAELQRRAPQGRIVASGIVNIHNVWFQVDTTRRVSVVVDTAPWDAEPCAARACAYRTLDRFCEFFIQTNTYGAVEVLLVGAGPVPAGLPGSFSRVEVPASAGTMARLNAGAAQATGDHLVFLDAGCLFDTPEPLEQLVGLNMLDGVGAAAPKTLYANGRVKGYGVAVTPAAVLPLYRGYEEGFPGYQCNTRAFQDASACGLQGLTVSRDLFERLGGFDEGFAGELGAVDLCHRVLCEGLRVALTCTVRLRTADACPERFFLPDENAADYPALEVARFDAKWPGARAAGDPWYSPNLDQASGYCQLPPSAPIHG